MNKLNVQYNNENLRGIKMSTDVTVSGCPTNSFEVNNETCGEIVKGNSDQHQDEIKKLNFKIAKISFSSNHNLLNF